MALIYCHVSTETRHVPPSAVIARSDSNKAMTEIGGPMALSKRHSDQHLV